MKKINTVFLLCTVLWAIASYAGVESGNDNLAESINYLMSYVKQSDCIFIRNGKEHTPQEAIAHIQKKYGHFRDEIKSPEDFIRLTATKSLMTGKPYLIKTKDGRMLKSDTWLLKALQAYRTKSPRQ